MDDELQALKEALADLGFDIPNYRDPAAPIAVKSFDDGDLEIFAKFEPAGGIHNDRRGTENG